MLRDITLGQYYQADSLLHRLDCRVKLVGIMAMLKRSQQKTRVTSRSGLPSDRTRQSGSFSIVCSFMWIT